ncbi:mannitol dehydrogenase family protein [Euzebya rosea]|uniref:mannitol dehydrogenase family protein n=1 Tax=Euzebya rosea TaxID=2052804 RepID=UPI00196A5916|nr:mannitol dehydrogenase family protein [Euzebya rosea]
MGVPDMKLRPDSLSEADDRLRRPDYDRTALRRSIVHIGVGGFHRAHLATYVDELCRGGHTDWSIVGAGVLPHDAAMAQVMADQDGLYTLLVRDRDGVEATVIGSIVDYVHAHPDPEPLVARIAHADTAIVSLTVTEGGYPVDDVTGEFDPDSHNAAPGSAFAALVAGLARRRADGAPPITVLSCDNVIGNGTVTRTATLGLARTTDPDLADWIERTVAFPNSMVDRITPATTDEDRAWLSRERGLDDAWPVATEPFRQWVVEDHFSGPRLPLEDLDVIVTDDVEPYELFKLRLLNAGHSCLAYLARVAGHRRVDEVMAEDRFAEFLRTFLDAEAGPVVPPAPGIDLEDYKASLVTRFANPAIGDQVDRLCIDGSSKFPKFLVPTIQRQLAAGGPVELSMLALAGWCRYLQGAADDGTALELSADPHLAEAMAFADAARADPAAFLGYRRVFGEALAGDPTVHEAFTEALTRLTADGVRVTIDHTLDRQ